MNLFSKFNSAPSSMSEDAFSKAAVVASLKKMFQSEHFSICTIDSCLKILNLHPHASTYNALSAIHCVSWADMDDALKNEVFVRTLTLFDTTSFDLSKIDVINMVPEDSNKEVFKLLRNAHAI